MKTQFTTNSPEETEQMGFLIGKNLKGGECIEFESDLGGGKTTFVRGLVAGADGNNQVSSPTFTISQIYTCSKFSIYHYDFYRLSDPGLVKEELSETLSSKDSVIVVEWAESVRGALPKERLTIEISKDARDENSRKFLLNYPEKLSYLTEGIA